MFLLLTGRTDYVREEEEQAILERVILTVSVKQKLVHTNDPPISLMPCNPRLVSLCLLSVASALL